MKEKIPYDVFIYSHQFSRKIALWRFLLTKKALILFILSLLLLIFYRDKDMYGQYLAVFLIAIIGILYLNTKLKYVSKLAMIENNGTDDEKNKGVLIFSKINWALKKEFKKEKFNEKN